MRPIALLAAAAALTAGLAATPSAATPSASSANERAAAAVTHFSGSNCPSRSLCLYRDYNFTGGGVAIKAGDYVGFLGDYGFNDQMSSWSNDTGVTCWWWTHAYRGGDSHIMYNGYRVNVLASENDTASSVQC
ncbi:peptidase inhibitor family I36 protein [Streptomyces sp. NPDC020412]|uniref:peptidase inhibitor family I36 protein n=1 Tax=Streptomyces sp. NPDC020412 TaxID=3365073 RepID=UPI0037AEB308